MGQLSVAPAMALDLLEAADDAGRPRLHVGRAAFKLYALQVADGCAVTIRDAAGELCCVAGLYPEDGDDAELWFAAGPALRANLWAALKAGARALEACATAAAPLRVKAYVAPQRVAGQRLARWLKLRAEGLIDSEIGPLSVWTRRF